MQKYLDYLNIQGINIDLIFRITSIVIAAFIVERLLSYSIRYWYRKREDITPAEVTRLRFIKNGIKFVVFTATAIAIIYTVPTMKALAVTLFAGAGILVAIIGFAAQKAFGNIVSGIFIVLFKPFRVGDMIKVGSLHSGTVQDITLRHTVINNWENRMIIIPNSVISEETIINSSIDDMRTCEYVEFTISYGSNVDKAKAILTAETIAHPSNIDIRTEEEIRNGVPRLIVRVVGLEDSAVRLRAYAWANEPVAAIIMRYDLYETVKKRFDAEGIEIPFPHRTLVFKNELTVDGNRALLNNDKGE
jgi:small-conductance mechanosensitive channel